MSQAKQKYTTREAGEVCDRIAGLIGYCSQDGSLHDPEMYNKKLLRSKWKCPECGHTVGKTEITKARELRWSLEEKTLSEGGRENREIDMDAINEELGLDEDVSEDIWRINKIINEQRNQ